MCSYDLVIYISSSTDKTIKSFEKKFKKFVSHNGINNYILYLDMEQEENVEIDSFLMNNYLSQSLNRIKSIKTPNLLYFKDGEIEDLLYIRESEISIKDVEQFLKRNGVIEND